jgi:hypothetical protein
MPEEAVRRYYDLLDRRHFEPTDAMLGVAVQKQEGSPVWDRRAGWGNHRLHPVLLRNHYKRRPYNKFTFLC